MALKKSLCILHTSSEFLCLDTFSCCQDVGGIVRSDVYET